MHLKSINQLPEGLLFHGPTFDQVNLEQKQCVIICHMLFWFCDGFALRNWMNCQGTVVAQHTPLSPGTCQVTGLFLSVKPELPSFGSLAEIDCMERQRHCNSLVTLFGGWFALVEIIATFKKTSINHNLHKPEADHGQWNTTCLRSCGEKWPVAPGGTPIADMSTNEKNSWLHICAPHPNRNLAESAAVVATAPVHNYSGLGGHQRITLDFAGLWNIWSDWWVLSQLNNLFVLFPDIRSQILGHPNKMFKTSNQW